MIYNELYCKVGTMFYYFGRVWVFDGKSVKDQVQFFNIYWSFLEFFFRLAMIWGTVMKLRICVCLRRYIRGLALEFVDHSKEGIIGHGVWGDIWEPTLEIWPLWSREHCLVLSFRSQALFCCEVLVNSNCAREQRLGKCSEHRPQRVSGLF